MIKILIVDDHVLFREGLVSLFRDQPDFEVVGEAETAHEAFQKALEVKPTLVLMDIGLPDQSGLEAAKHILAELPGTKIVMLTIHVNDDLLFNALSVGVKGYLLKNTPVAKLIAALRGLERGEAALSRTMTGRFIDEFNRRFNTKPIASHELDNLTARELEVLQLVSSGSSNQDIAQKLFITESTVKVHVHNIMEKLKCRNRRELQRLVQERGFTGLNSAF